MNTALDDLIERDHRAESGRLLVCCCEGEDGTEGVPDCDDGSLRAGANDVEQVVDPVGDRIGSSPAGPPEPARRESEYVVLTGRMLDEGAVRRDPTTETGDDDQRRRSRSCLDDLEIDATTDVQGECAGTRAVAIEEFDTHADLEAFRTTQPQDDEARATIERTFAPVGPFTVVDMLTVEQF